MTRESKKAAQRYDTTIGKHNLKSYFGHPELKKIEEHS